MSRGWNQILTDAQTAAEAVREAGRPLGLGEIAEALRNRGRRLSDGQVKVSVKRAQQIGLLRRHGAYRWDVPPAPSSAETMRAIHRADPPTQQVLIVCARKMLELAPSADNNRAVRKVLDLALQPVGPADLAVSGAGDKRPPPRTARSDITSNGVGRHDHPEVKVRIPTDS